MAIPINIEQLLTGRIVEWERLDGKKDDKKDDKKEPSDNQCIILNIIRMNDKITIPEMARKTSLSERTISRELKSLRDDLGLLIRVGGRKDGHWVIRELNYKGEDI